MCGLYKMPVWTMTAPELMHQPFLCADGLRYDEVRGQPSVFMTTKHWHRVVAGENTWWMEFRCWTCLDKWPCKRATVTLLSGEKP